MILRSGAGDAFERNPFQDLYLTEALSDPELFLTWFSQEVITGQTQALYRPGNIVLQGTNGAGKTMLLKLFSPEIQTAYLRHHYKAPLTSGPVLAVGINFIHAGAGSFGARHLDPQADPNRQLWAAVFADFLNYYLVDQLCETLAHLQAAAPDFARQLGVTVTDTTFEAFSSILSRHDCWFGYLQDVDSFSSLRRILHQRIDRIRAFINWNIDALPAEILRTKTEIGRPLDASREALTSSGILAASEPLVVTIDQYETLVHVDYETERDPNKSMGHTLCRVVNTFLAQRNPSVSFKVGVRPYSWPRELRLHNSDARLELGRDYQLVNLDATLSRDENRGTWIFPRFAEDVSARRIAYYFNTDSTTYQKWMEVALGKLLPNAEIAKYTRKRTEALVPRFGPWPEAWRKSLELQAELDLYKASLQELWMMQARDRDELNVSVLRRSPKPWDRPYFKKERKEALLTQIASSTNQRRLYAGWDTVVTLSGGNILVFLSLCREMWDLAQRARVRNGKPIQSEFTVELQAQAIWNVAGSWLAKQDEFPGGGLRRRFLTRLGMAFRRGLLRDVKLSNPGRTGFSIEEADLDRPDAQDVRAFLNDATDFGALIRRKHTTKEREGGPRQKWYLFPVLCPYFDLPAIRTKEPYYTSVEEVRRWITDDRQFSLRRSDGVSESDDDSEQRPLFDR